VVHLTNHTSTEILPIFSRLELESGKWVPRHLPPNFGAARDIPLEANIHPTVEAMHRAGVLSKDQMPILGGTDPPIPTIPGAAAMFAARARKRKEEIAKRRKQGKKPDTQVNGEARHWGGVGDVVARTWG